MPESDRGSPPLQLTSPTLQRLFEEEGARLRPALEERTFGPGDALCTLAAPPAGLFLIVAGEVSVTRPTAGRASLPIEILRQGDALGAQQAGGEGPRIEARAITPTSALLLPRERIARLAGELPALAAGLAAAGEVEAMRRPFLAAMRRAHAFRGTSPRQIARLFSEAEPIERAPGEAVVHQGERPSGFYLVVQGELTAAQRPRGAMFGESGPASRASAMVHRLHPGDLFGDQAMITGEELATVSAALPARLLWVPADSYERLLGVSSSFRRRIGQVAAGPAAPSERAPVTGAAPFPAHMHAIEVLLLQSDVPAAPLGALADLLAQALASEHGDDVAVLELAPPGEAPRGPARDPEIPWLARLRVPVADGPGAAAAVEAALIALGHAYDRVFLDASGRDAAFAARLAPVLSERHGRAVSGRPLTRGKVVFLSRDPLAQRLPDPLRTVPIASAALIGAPRLPPAEGVTRERAYPPGTARVRLDLAGLARLRRPEELRLAALPAAARATLSRWARAISDRAVGVALGGGGAWGFAHVALIRAMHEVGVPIDRVSGTSFGALAGAFYCAEGLTGLERLLDLGARANRATSASFFTSRALERFVDEHLGALRLEDLEVPLFPVATDLSRGVELVLSIGTVGAGVRASGAFPGMFTPVTGGGAYCVDGGFINNVPASVLASEGADLIVASNIVAAPPPIVPAEPLIRGRLGRLLHEFNPLSRPLDLIRAGFVLMHASGERESEFADVVFASDPIELAPSERRTLRDAIFRGKIPFWDFTVGRKVAEKAGPKARLTATQIKAQWQQLSRGSRLP